MKPIEHRNKNICGILVLLFLMILFLTQKLVIQISPDHD